MLTLVVPGQEDAERDAVIAAWTRAGHNVCRLEKFWEPPSLEPASIRLYGDMIFCLYLAERWGLELVSPPDDLLLQTPARWLARRVQALSLVEALSQPYPLFIKSLVPKVFRAALYETASELEQEVAGLAADTPVIVSEPVTFINEVRCLILDGSVVSTACYEGTADTEAAASFAQTFARAYPTAATFVLDVGWIKGRGWAVIEANAAWGAGLNGCAPDQMADCLEVATRVRTSLPVS